MNDEIPASVVREALTRYRDSPFDIRAALVVAVEWARKDERALWDAFGARKNWSLEYKRPIYGDDDDQEECWIVYEESGGINDREWTVMGKGETPVDAVVAAIRSRGE